MQKSAPVDNKMTRMIVIVKVSLMISMLKYLSKTKCPAFHFDLILVVLFMTYDNNNIEAKMKIIFLKVGKSKTSVIKGDSKSHCKFGINFLSI